MEYLTANINKQISNFEDQSHSDSQKAK